MTSRQARVDGLNEDLSALSAKIDQLYEDLETVVEEVAEEANEGTTETRIDGGHVGWEEVETAGPDGEREVESVEWTPVDTESSAGRLDLEAVAERVADVDGRGGPGRALQVPRLAFDVDTSVRELSLDRVDPVLDDDGDVVEVRLFGWLERVARIEVEDARLRESDREDRPIARAVGVESLQFEAERVAVERDGVVDARFGDREVRVVEVTWLHGSVSGRVPHKRSGQRPYTHCCSWAATG
jgi:hypothetical protein